jgi:glycine/D-amino acid oxidase-like deaminating enzyme
VSARTFDIVIVGGGIVGAACALECVSAGLSVAVVEEHCIGGGATAAGMGHIVVMDDSDAQFSLTRYSQQLWRELAQELPPACEYVESGTMWIAADEEEMEEVRRKFAFYRERGVPAEIADAHKLETLEPHLRKGLTGALLVPEDAVVYPPCVAGHLVERATDKGAAVFLGGCVNRLDDGGVVLQDGTQLSGGAMVNAAGSKAPQLTRNLQVQPRKGHLVITDRYPGFVRHQLVELGYLKSAHKSTADSVAFNAQPRRTGQVLLGSSRQFGPEDGQVDQAILSRMLLRASEYMPGISELLAIRVWTGFRAATPDKLPLIGKAPGYERVYAATGHEGLGITTSLGTAKLLADDITGRASAISRAPYLAERTMAAHV